MGVTVKPPFYNLGETSTYEVRAALWLPLDLAHPEQDGRTGTVMVRQHKRATGGSEADLYAVEYRGKAIGEMGWRFRFENLTDLTNPGPYDVTVGPNVSVCTCKAGECKTVHCKHRAIGLLIVEKSLLDLSETDEERESGLCFTDEPGAPTVSELTGGRKHVY